jgi:hypothetical protein
MENAGMKTMLLKDVCISLLIWLAVAVLVMPGFARPAFAITRPGRRILSRSPR